MNERMKETEVREYLVEDDSRIPNNPTLPLLVYPQALDGSEQDSARCKELLAENDMQGRVRTTPVAVGDTLYVMTESRLWALRNKK